MKLAVAAVLHRNTEFKETEIVILVLLDDLTHGVNIRVMR